MSRSFHPVDEFLYSAFTAANDSPISMSCLFKMDVLTLWRPLVNVGASVGNITIYSLVFNSSRVKVYTRSVSTVRQASSTGATISAGVWYHGGMINYNDNSRAAFLNGGNKGTDASNVNPDPVLIDQVMIGRWSQLASSLDADVAEVGIWNAALTDAEMAILGKHVSPLCVRPQNLVFYMPLIRDNDEDLIGRISMGTSGTPGVRVHPRVFYIAPPSISHLVSGGAVEKYGPRIQVI